jgi:hypothetical protein
MTTELEKEFFDTFGIEAISKWHKCKDYSCVCCDEYDNCAKREFIYPEITDRVLLELICIFSQHCNFGRWNKYAMHSIDDFKYIILSQLIAYQNKRYTYGIQEKIQQLFKGGE